MSRVDEPQKPNCFSVGTAHDIVDNNRRREKVKVD